MAYMSIFLNRSTNSRSLLSKYQKVFAQMDMLTCTWKCRGDKLDYTIENLKTIATRKPPSRNNKDKNQLENYFKVI